MIGVTKGEKALWSISGRDKIIMFERVSWKECSIARQRATKIIKDVQALLRKKYIFSPHLVGSGNWGTMIKDDKGEYDLDYQLVLTHNSSEYKKNGLKDPTQIKNDFIRAFREAAKATEIIQDSTTAITLVNKDGKPFHIDFVIIKPDGNGFQIIRRNNARHSSINEYTWNKLPNPNKAYGLFNALTPEEKKHLIEDILIPRKIKEKAKREDDLTKISSCSLFIREINNYYANRTKNR